MKRVVRTTVPAMVALLAAPVAVAQTLPTSCSTASYGASLVVAPTVENCYWNPSLSCTTAIYQVTGTPPNIAGLMPGILLPPTSAPPYPLQAVTSCAANDTVCNSITTGNQVFLPGQGDPNTGLGTGDASRQAFSVNPRNGYRYKVWLLGKSYGLDVVPVTVKGGGNKLESCGLAGPAQASAAAANPLATQRQSLTEVVGGRCVVTVGPPLNASGDPTVTVTGAGCTAKKIPANQVKVSITGGEVTDPTPADLLFSEGISIVVKGSTCTWKQYYPSTGPWWYICY